MILISLIFWMDRKRVGVTKPNFERVRRPTAAGATSVIVTRRQKGIWRMKDCLQSANHLVNENDGSVCVYVFTPHI